MSISWGKDADLDAMAARAYRHTPTFLALLTGFLAGGLLGMAVGLILGLAGR